MGWYQEPSVIRSTDTRAEERILRGDGDLFVLTGGQDIYPGLYGQEITNAHWWNPNRDIWEVLGYIAARRVGMPVLGICRGHQLMVALNGGTLYQDIMEDAGRAYHDYTHPLEVVSDIVDLSWLPSKSFAASAGSVYCNSIHHQAACDTPCNGIVVARALDGLTEAIFYPGIGLGVQWHPEGMNTPGVVPAAQSARSTAATEDELNSLRVKLNLLTALVSKA